MCYFYRVMWGSERANHTTGRHNAPRTSKHQQTQKSFPLQPRQSPGTGQEKVLSGCEVPQIFNFQAKPFPWPHRQGRGTQLLLSNQPRKDCSNVARLATSERQAAGIKCPSALEPVPSPIIPSPPPAGSPFPLSQAGATRAPT